MHTPQIADLLRPAPSAPSEPAAAPELEEEPDVAAEIAKEKTPARKMPKHRSGSLAHPYPMRDGTTFKVKSGLNFTTDFADDFHLFAAQFLRRSSKSEWAQRVLEREIARTRRRARKATE